MTLKGWMAILLPTDICSKGLKRGGAGRCYEVSVSLFGISLNPGA
jgi:hypothetical protein